MEGSDFVKLYMKEGCLSWEAAGEKKSKVTTHFFSNFFFLNMYRQHARHQGCICGSQLGLYIRIIQGGFQEKCLGHALRDSDEIAWERDPGICNSINIIHHSQAGFISGMKRFFSICKSISVIHHINKLKNKIHRIISVSSGQSLSCV